MFFLLHALLTRSDSETSHHPLHTYSWQGPPWFGKRGDLGTLGTEETGGGQCATERVQTSTSEHWEQGDGGAPGPKPGFFLFQPTSVPWVPLPVLKQGMFLDALCLGTLGLLPKPLPGPSPPCPPWGQLLW